MDFADGITITIIRPAGFDDYGDRGPGEERIESPGWAFAPRVGGPATWSRDVSDRGREGLTEGITGYGPYGVDLRHGDEIEIPSGPFAGRWKASGNPGNWEQPMTGWKPGVEVGFDRKEG